MIPRDNGEPLSDDALLEAIGTLYAEADPPPTDLAEGVLARLDAEDLDAELLTLVEFDRELAGVRSATMLRAPDEVGTWSLEYLGPGFRAQVRISRTHREARLDGWVMPAQPMAVHLTAMGKRGDALEADLSASGRFEFTTTPVGACRLTFHPPGGIRPLVTPPFWI